MGSLVIMKIHLDNRALQWNKNLIDHISILLDIPVAKADFLSYCDSRNMIASVGRGPGGCLTKAIVSQLLWLLSTSPLATMQSNGIDISFSTFKIACVASFQKCALWDFNSIGLLRGLGTCSW